MHLVHEFVTTHNGFVVGGDRENCCIILDPACDCAMEIHDDGGVSFFANVLPPDLVWGVLPRKMHDPYT
jgi:hypothetical protein